jgi:glucokinase
VGIDAGGTWVRAALGDDSGNVLKRESQPVDCRSNDSFLRQLQNIVIDVCSGDPSGIEGVGVAVAGRLDIWKGILDYSPHTSLRNVKVRVTLERSLSERVIILNDNLAAAFAEWSEGAGAGRQNVVYVGIGTGIGGGVVADGRILIGKEGNAHEMGHMIIDLEGRLKCSCGGRGHWEAYTSGSGLPNFAKLLSAGYNVETPFSCCAKEGSIEARAIFDAARGGDKFAGFVIDESARMNGVAFANLTDLYDPELIVVGGGVALKNRELVVDRITPYLKEYAFNGLPAVRTAALGEEAPLIGALLSVFNPVFRH